MTDMLSLNFALGRVIIALDRLQLQPGVGAHRLRLPTKISATWLTADGPDQLVPLVVTGRLWAEHPGMRWVGDLAPVFIAVRGYEVSEDLWLTVTDDQLLALDHVRGAGDLQLRLDLSGLIVGGAPGPRPPSTDQLGLRVPSAEWSSLLDQASLEVGVLIRVPTPAITPAASADEPEASIAQAGVRLREARQQLRAHEWEAAVQTARKIMESVNQIDDRSSKVAPASLPARERDQGQRWAELRRSLYQLASGASHDDDITRGFTWSRADAETVVAVAAGMLARSAAKLSAEGS